MDNKQITKNIAANLKKLRKRKGKTQEDVINAIKKYNLSLRSYKTYESGKATYTPSLDKLTLLADYFGVSLDYLIYNKSTTFDDSFTKEDCLKRLGRLIYSLVLRPVKELDPNSKYFGKYVFLSFDPDVSLFIDSIETKAAQNNNLFEYDGINNYKGINDFDNAIACLDNLKEDWSPAKERFDALLLESGINPDEYFEQRLNRINSRRIIGIAKKRKTKSE